MATRGYGALKVFLITSMLLLNGLILLDTEGSISSALSIDRPVADIGKVGNWTVTGIETYTDSTIDLNGNLSISGTLILDNTILTINSSGFNGMTIDVLNGGTFTIRNGSLIHGLHDQRYLFNSQSGSNVMINGSRVRDCGIPGENFNINGIYTRSRNFNVLHSIIESGEIGIIGDGANIRIWGTNISNMADTGILMVNNTVVDATMVNFSQCIRTGIDVRSSDLDLVWGQFQEVEYSIDSFRSTMDISGTILSGLGFHSTLINSSVARIIDTRPLKIGMDLIKIGYPAGAPSDVLLLNSTFFQVDNFDPTSYVREAYRFDVKVMTNDGEPAEDADVEIKDVTGAKVFQGLTNEFGYIEDIPLATAKYNLTGKHPLGPHNVSVFFEGATRQRDADASLVHFIEMEVLLFDPRILFEYPVEGSWISTSEFFLIGRVVDHRPITDLWMSIDGSQEFKIPKDVDLSIKLDLFDGEHVVRIIAKNDDGRYGAGNLSFGIDSVAPTIVVASPVSGIYTNESNIMIQGTCSVDADLVLDGSMVHVNQTTGEFKASVFLKEGKNQIIIQAVDRAGNTDEVTLIVNKDGSPPRLIIFSPANGTTINKDEILITGSTDFDTEHVWIAGVEVEIEMGSFEGLATGLEEGSNRISVVAQDMTGARTTRFVLVMVDTTAPDISLTEYPSLTNQDRVTVRGVTDPGTTVIINGQLVIVEGGLFSSEVELVEGENDITIIARDNLGNTNVIYETIILDTEVPSFESVYPASGTTTKNPILEIRCKLYDENGIDVVKGRVGSETFKPIASDDDFNWIINLISGENFVDIEATDEAGNTVLKQLVYTYTPKGEEQDTTKPTIVITLPRVNESVVEGTITIEGWAMDNDGIASILVRIGDGEWQEVQGPNAWSLDVELTPGLYRIEAKAIDNSGNEDLDRVWANVVIDTDDSGGDGSNSSPKTLIIIIVIIFVVLVGFVFGYLLVMRNKNLRKEYEAVKQRNDDREKEQERRRPSARSRVTRRVGRPPSRERP